MIVRVMRFAASSFTGSWEWKRWWAGLDGNMELPNGEENFLIWTHRRGRETLGYNKKIQKCLLNFSKLAWFAADVVTMKTLLLSAIGARSTPQSFSKFGKPRSMSGIRKVSSSHIVSSQIPMSYRFWWHNWIKRANLVTNEFY